MASREGRDVLPSSIIPTLQTYPSLSTLYSYINGSTTLFNLLNNANDFTFLAPTNDAISQWILTAQGNNTPPADVIEAQLSYHLLNGSWPTENYTDKPQFVATELTNSSYSNVTIYPGGQRVELLNGFDGEPFILSSNKTAANITRRDIPCLNGLIQIIDSVLTIPISAVLLTAQAQITYFIAILNRANFLSVNDAGLVEFVNYVTQTPNMTLFFPNTPAALAAFNAFGSDISPANLTALFEYHIVPDYVLYSPDLVNGTSFQTTMGDNLTITVVGNETYVNSAKILSTDYMIVNGVFHTLDSLLDRFNQSTPLSVTAANSSTSTTPSTSASASASASTATSASTHSGLSTGAKAAIGVVIPVIVLAVLAGLLLFWRKKKKKATRTQNELSAVAAAGEVEGKPAVKELGSNDPAAREMHAADVKKELYTEAPPRELHSEAPPQELAGGVHSHPAVELE